MEPSEAAGSKTLSTTAAGDDATHSGVPEPSSATLASNSSSSEYDAPTLEEVGTGQNCKKCNTIKPADQFISFKTRNVLKTCRACQTARSNVLENPSIVLVGKRPRSATHKEQERISAATNDETERMEKRRKTELRAAERQSVAAARSSLRAKDLALHR